MMYFTESDPASCDDPVSLNDEFEEKYDAVEYEAEMSRLLRRAYKRLKDEMREKDFSGTKRFLRLNRVTITFFFC